VRAFEWIKQLFTGDRWRMTMSKADQDLWSTPRSHLALGELMAEWLEGAVASRPGYAPNYGPDEETEELIPVLAAMCRVGLVTTGSQPACAPETGADGFLWRQRAWVEFWCDDRALGDLMALLEAQERQQVMAVFARADGSRTGEEIDPVPVTQRASVDRRYWWRAHTAVGGLVSRQDFSLSWDETSEEMDDVLRNGWVVNVFDLDWGRHHLLWPLMFRFVQIQTLRQVEDLDGPLRMLEDGMPEFSTESDTKN
jgi:hypothetical protein